MPRIHGELLKLGIEIAQSTVAKHVVAPWRFLEHAPYKRG